MKRLMKRLIRRIVDWAYGDNLTLRLAFLERRQYNISTMFYDAILRMSYKDAGIDLKGTIHCEEVKTWPATEESENDNPKDQ